MITYLITFLNYPFLVYFLVLLFSLMFSAMLLLRVEIIGTDVGPALGFHLPNVADSTWRCFFL